MGQTRAAANNDTDLTRMVASVNLTIREISVDPNNCLKPNNLLPNPDLSMGKFQFICRNHLQSWLTGIGQSIVTR